MKKTLVWEVLSQLSSKDLRAFAIFLKSPFFNPRKDIVKINHFLSTAILKNKAIPSKEKVLASAYPNEEYDDKKMGLMLSYLHKVLENFLWIQEVKNTDYEKEKWLIRAYRKGKMPRNFDRTLKKVGKALESQGLRNPAHYFTRFDLEYQKYLSLVETGRAKKMNLEIVENHLDFAYISTKLRQVCFSLSHEAVFNVQYDSVLSEHLMTLAEEDLYKNVPAIALYHRFILLFQKGDISEFEAFKKYLFQQTKHFTAEEFRDMYMLTLNFCIKKVNNNHHAFYAETYDMYKKGIEMNLLFEDEKLSPFSFTNIVGIAIRQNELLWAEGFIYNYKDCLDETYKVATFSLNIARLEFAKKNYKKVLFFLQKTDYEDFINRMTSKILEIKTHYELKEFDRVDNLIQSAMVLIRRKKGMGYHYQIWKNILHYTQKLGRVNPYDKTATESLKEQIRVEKILPEREWLLAKVSEI